MPKPYSRPSRSSRHIRTLGSAGWSVAKYTGRTADKAAGGLFRWMTTDHYGFGDAFSRMPKMGFLDTVSYVFMHFLIAIAGAILSGILAFILIGFIFFLLSGHL